MPYWGFDGKRRLNRMRAIEEPGPFFHPLLATLTTGARPPHARHRRAPGRVPRASAGPSATPTRFALARPEGMSDAEFLERAERVRRWFEPLNPYDGAGELFKLEEQNFRLAGWQADRSAAPLYCFAVSAKRYALFNLDRHHARCCARSPGTASAT